MQSVRMGVSLVVVACLGGAASAGNVEPDDFANGTDISNSFAGVTLTTVLSESGFGIAGGSVFSYNSPFASTGSRTFGNSNFIEFGANAPNLKAVFASGTVSSVSIDVIGDIGSDFGFLSAFRADNSLIQRVETGQLPSFVSQTLTVVSGLNEIAYVVTGGKGHRALFLDNLQFTDVVIPLPSAAGMGMIGLVVIGARRRRA